MSISDKITAQAPATCANLGSGFDVLGIALHAPFDRVAVCRNSHQRIRLTRVEGDNGKLPAKGLANVAVFVCAEFLRRIGSRQGVDIELEKGVPISSGLGSSAASSVATLKALNQLFESPLTDLELLQLAMQGEAHLSGALHADNVAPSLLGGLVLVAEN
ncbi:homoserine kinase, partial [candidate division KSB1 bacterium]|nr:homoserine kinase [candidate division KSB1 bacterium]